LEAAENVIDERSSGDAVSGEAEGALAGENGKEGEMVKGQKGLR